MAEILEMTQNCTPENILDDIIDRAKEIPLKAIVIITKDMDDIYEVRSTPSTSALERIGMCHYAANVLLKNLQVVE